ncbi:MAG: 3-oxoacyl-[acyl-carrier-protein] reductase [Chloroflexi bacterium]|nr:3-oxoacyl-[acyl-carrier-protein] reductase [Chloroflexota bacterium]
MTLERQVALVTGAARGIGRYAAHTLARAGASLVLADITSLDDVAGEIAEMRSEVLSVTIDVRDEAQVAAMVEQAMARFGRIDVLVNNAGIVTHFNWGLPRWAPIRSMEKAFWDRVVDTNLGGTFLCTKHALTVMGSQGGGHVINLHGYSMGVGAAAYVVSKDAIRTFTRFVADEERENNVCVLAVGPPSIATEEAPKEAREAFPGPDVLGDIFVLAAEAPMELSGNVVALKEGKLEVVS